MWRASTSRCGTNKSVRGRPTHPFRRGCVRRRRWIRTLEDQIMTKKKRHGIMQHDCSPGPAQATPEYIPKLHFQDLDLRNPKFRLNSFHGPKNGCSLISIYINHHVHSSNTAYPGNAESRPCIWSELVPPGLLGFEVLIPDCCDQGYAIGKFRHSLEPFRPALGFDRKGKSRREEDTIQAATKCDRLSLRSQSRYPREDPRH